MVNLKNIWLKEENNAFQGWDFSYLDRRWQDETLPWNYEEIILKYLKKTDKLLDMGTGGGEFLLSLNHPYNLKMNYINEIKQYILRSNLI